MSMETRLCNTCGEEKDISLFPREMRDGAWYFRPKCKRCVKEVSKQSKKLWLKNNKDRKKEINKTWYQKNKKIIIEKNSNYKKNNRKLYNENLKNKRKSDPVFRLRDNVRTIIRLMINKNYGSKNGSSMSSYLEYTIEELKVHLEKQFEPWMTWSNCGTYRSETWDDNDRSTWTWQLDHIIPQSDLPYASMEDDNFKKCWSLSNLRPLSAKINSIEGANRIRHQKAA